MLVISISHHKIQPNHSIHAEWTCYTLKQEHTESETRAASRNDFNYNLLASPKWALPLFCRFRRGHPRILGLCIGNDISRYIGRYDTIYLSFYRVPDMSIYIAPDICDISAGLPTACGVVSSSLRTPRRTRKTYVTHMSIWVNFSSTQWA